jgi:hypothetical protein
MVEYPNRVKEVMRALAVAESEAEARALIPDDWGLFISREPGGGKCAFGILPSGIPEADGGNYFSRAWSNGLAIGHGDTILEAIRIGATKAARVCGEPLSPFGLALAFAERIERLNVDSLALLDAYRESDADSKDTLAKAFAASVWLDSDVRMPTELLSALRAVSSQLSPDDVEAGLDIVRRATTFDFGDGNGPVPARRHLNPDGSEGGWVADTATVEPTAYLGPASSVFGHARVCGHARVYGDASVFGHAELFADAQVYGHAWVYGHAKVSGTARVYGRASVSDSAKVSGDAEVGGPAIVCGYAVLDSGRHASGIIESTPEADRLRM